MEENLLELILEYKMTKLEAKAWKVALMYLKLVKKYFPKYSFRLKKGDPRKSLLFKYCYKLVNESELKDEEFKFYITAQIQILKNIDGAMFEPNCLVGENAWKRWMVWKKLVLKSPIDNDAETGYNHKNKVIEILKETKQFLGSKFELNKENIISTLENRNMFRWCGRGDVSGYYLALSPLVTSWAEGKKVNLLDCFTIDVNFYRSRVDEDIKKYFSEEFEYEFK